MKAVYWIAAAFTLLLTLASVNAFSEMDIEMPENIYVSGEKTIEITVFNPSLEDRDLSVKFLAPDEFMDFEFKNVPGEIRGEGSEKFTLTIKPKSEVFGTHYIASLSAKLGSETVLKETKLHFSKPGGEEGEEGGEGWVFPVGAFFLGLGESSELFVNFILLLIAIILFVVFLVKLRER